MKIPSQSCNKCLELYAITFIDFMLVNYLLLFVISLFSIQDLHCSLKSLKSIDWPGSRMGFLLHQTNKKFTWEIKKKDREWKDYRERQMHKAGPLSFFCCSLSILLLSPWCTDKPGKAEGVWERSSVTMGRSLALQSFNWTSWWSRWSLKPVELLSFLMRLQPWSAKQTWAQKTRQ